jgi:hypothetical protein
VYVHGICPSGGLGEIFTMLEQVIYLERLTLQLYSAGRSLFRPRQSARMGLLPL